MTAREARLHRLIVLRGLQHEMAVAALRVAQDAFRAAETAFADAVHAGVEAQTSMNHSLRHADGQGWLIACADAEFAKSTIAVCSTLRERAAIAVQKAHEHEREARCVAMQMSAVMQRMQQETAQQAARDEQAFLDEAGRLQKILGSRWTTMSEI